MSIYNHLCRMGTPPAIRRTMTHGLCLLQDGRLVLYHNKGMGFMVEQDSSQINRVFVFNKIWASWWNKTLHKSTGFSSSIKYPNDRVGVQRF
ncbi:hypothetical protein BRARA_D01450 [Brassica rapa]|uniref:Uncharacterized protein n=1 Tax=Brassica campestris TaxID=3711 RepID=A0A397ZPL1_BRACM|nr:hypothetical protein BRARA_D01450 [Brassica rapa]